MPENTYFASNMWSAFRNRSFQLSGRSPSFPADNETATANWMRMYFVSVSDARNFSSFNWGSFPVDVFQYFNPDLIPALSPSTLLAYNRLFCRFMIPESMKQLTPSQFEFLNDFCFSELPTAVWKVVSLEQIDRLSSGQLSNFPEDRCSQGAFSAMTCNQIGAIRSSAIQSIRVSRKIQDCWLEVCVFPGLSVVPCSYSSFSVI